MTSHKANARNSYLLRTYGITLAEFEAILEAQQHCCCICGRSLVDRRIEVDHDHRLARQIGKRGSVRGLLCGGRYQGCNRKLGKIDDAKWLRSAANYLEAPPARSVLT